jgi:SAM-dependent methyltransferase
MDRLIERTAEVEDRHFWFHGLRRHARLELARALGGRPAGLIVDCGAGTGRNLDWLGEFGPALGLELNDAGVQFGRRRGRRMIRGDIMRMPFATGAADVATCFDVLYAFDPGDGRRLVREMRRIVRPGGVALFNVAALGVLRGAHSAWMHERHRYGRAELRQVLESEGWHVERLTFTNLSLFPLALGLRWVERVTGHESSGGFLSVPPAPINWMFDAALRLEAAWLRVGALPVGTSLLALVRNPA